MIKEVLAIGGFWIVFAIVSLWGQKKLKIGAWRENIKEKG